MRNATGAIAVRTERIRNHRCSVEQEDVGWFLQHLAEGLMNTTPDGSLIDKPQFLTQIARGFAMRRSVAHAVIVRLLGDFAISHARTS